MLKKLSISNYALIDTLEINWDSGFTIITGETGAGKSILLGAIGLVLGQRADSNSLKNKEIKCVVEVEFDLTDYDLAAVFDLKDWDYINQTTIRREISPSGKSRAFVNDTPVILSDLKELCDKLIDIHSQHQTLLLTENNFQLKVLDNYAKNNELLLSYQQFYSKYKQLQLELNELKIKNERALLDLDYLTFQFKELSESNLKENEINELEIEHEVLSHAEEIKQALASISSILQDDENNAITMLSQAKNIFNPLESKMKECSVLSSRIKTVIVELQDIVFEVEKILDKVQINPARLEEINERLSILFGLLQKHRVKTEAELIIIKNQLDNKINNITSLENEIEEKEKELYDVIQKLTDIAGKLSKNRNSEKEKLEHAITEILFLIGLPNAEFKINIETNSEFTSNGFDKVTFCFTANVGIEPAPLHKVGSGGELSRVMLAIKSVIAKRSFLPTIIFDEIDTGISGETADKAGKILKEMSKEIQVIAITHQAQIAAKGNTHLFVYKESEKNSTRSLIRKLNTSERIDEIAKMLSGEKVSKAALENAKQLLKN